MKCACGQEAWILGTEPIIVNVEQAGKMKHDKGHRLAMLTCHECGRVEFYHIDAVDLAMKRLRKKLGLENVSPTD